MCGRMAITLTHDAMAHLFDAAPVGDLPDLPDYNVCPTRPIAVVLSQGGRRFLQAMRWGFLPAWYRSPTDGPLLINARAESIADRPAFREAARHRRCLVPATGFYEWQRLESGRSQPWFVTRADGAPMVFAAVWQNWGEAEAQQGTVAIVTCPANAQMARIHPRLPVILEPGDWPLWLGEAGHGAARLMRAPPEGALRMVPVGPAINSARSRGADLIRPLDQDPISPA
ncbi:hypothetical protein ruthe_00686 [Rubellimicrobium thermophilum DSM 16684]|uniref:Abasic site processing protein n=1 Tax=Rubellimicrobium thermophilum DSM 16684 TaxID=1123069 RepID=S9R5M3_9RHOB|nr:SOS response-associated peptidase [Rubellimicrobium thermophilum]EPX87288.1 hypothetical protein ruthe_00686 [Rubellimicrobium thermophilum DSM 16684]